MIKRNFGDGVRSRRLRLAGCEVLAKGVVYNLHRSFFVVGLTQLLIAFLLGLEAVCPRIAVLNCVSPMWLCVLGVCGGL